MNTEYHIVLNVRTADGFERFGQFELGTDQRVAYALFETLEGREAEDDSGVLHLDLMETRNSLPMSMRVLNCTLEELARNVKCIARNVFKGRNLSEGLP
jgi:hypothetical protein